MTKTETTIYQTLNVPELYVGGEELDLKISKAIANSGGGGGKTFSLAEDIGSLDTINWGQVNTVGNITCGDELNTNSLIINGIDINALIDQRIAASKLVDGGGENTIQPVDPLAPPEFEILPI